MPLLSPYGLTLCLFFLGGFSEYHIPRNISCPVSPIGSPLLHPRSPQHLNGMMSPSPISSPRTTSGSSTPLTGGSGAIPLYHSQQSIYMQEGFGIVPKSSHGVFHNGTCYHDPNPNILRGIQSGPPALKALVASENEFQGKPVGRPCQSDLCNGQSVLADRVSQQLLREHVKLNPPLEFSPRSTLPSRTNGR